MFKNFKVLDLPTEFKRLKHRITRNDAELKKFRWISWRVKSSIAIIQLVNGSRISEAIDAYNKFIETGERKVKVNIRKRKIHHDTRTMLIPSFIKREWGYYRGKNYNMNMWLVKQYGYTTHSLRHAFVAFHVEKGSHTMLISKAIGHKDCRTVLIYMANVQSDRLLEDTACM